MNICDKCGKNCEFPCAALNALRDTYRRMRIETRAETLSVLGKTLETVDCEIAEDLRELAEQIIDRLPEMAYISELGIKVGYVRSQETKRSGGKAVLGECRKVIKTYTAYLPFDFIITIYDRNISGLTENQIKLLLLHELKHIGIGPRGLCIREHDTADFTELLERYGLKWTEDGQDLPDILND